MGIVSLPLHLLAVVLAAAAAGLAVSGRAVSGRAVDTAGLRRRRGHPPGTGATSPQASTPAEDPDPGRGRAPRVAGLLLVAVAAGLLLGVADGIHLLLGLVLLGGLSGAVQLVGRARAARAVEQRQARVVEVCEVLAAELRSGQPLLSSLEHTVEVWPAMGQVAAAARLDADVPLALHRLSRAPGAEGLRQVAAAWQVAADSGAGLAEALTQVAATAREAQSARRLVRSELASAQATARMVALLPVGSLAMAAGVGADPWTFLLETPAGVGCLAAGLVLAYAGLRWLDRIAESVLRR